ncbi:MAG: hypothetical protein ACREQ9_18545 [Candidatus Binatia bacterium]
MKVHLVDATWELFRNHFGAPARSAPDGRAVGAISGLLRTLLALLREEGVTHVGCAFDHVIESFRNELFAGYKTAEGVDPVSSHSSLSPSAPPARSASSSGR